MATGTNAISTRTEAASLFYPAKTVTDGNQLCTYDYAYNTLGFCNINGVTSPRCLKYSDLSSQFHVRGAITTPSSYPSCLGSYYTAVRVQNTTTASISYKVRIDCGVVRLNGSSDISESTFIPLNYKYTGSKITVAANSTSSRTLATYYTNVSNVKVPKSYVPCVRARFTWQDQAGSIITNSTNYNIYSTSNYPYAALISSSTLLDRIDLSNTKVVKKGTGGYDGVYYYNREATIGALFDAYGNFDMTVVGTTNSSTVDIFLKWGT